MEPAPDAPRLDRRSRLALVPAATRRVGGDLLVNVGGATAAVQRLGGAGPDLWEAFAGGASVAEAAVDLADRTRSSTEEVERVVLDFAQGLVRADLARPAP